MIQWVALFFSTTSLNTIQATDPTPYSVPNMVESLDYNHTAYTILKATATVGIYIDSLAGIEKVESKKRLYRSTEQTIVTNSSGVVQVVASKFGAKQQWVVTAVDNQYPLIDVPITTSTVSEDFRKDYETYVYGPDKMTVAQYCVNKVKLWPDMGFKLYRAEPYDFKDNINYRFKLQ